MFNTHKPWILATLLIGASAFGQNDPNSSCNKAECPPKVEKCKKPCPQPCPPTQMCQEKKETLYWPVPILNAAYNYPARVETGCPIDLFGAASFIYWRPVQENMEIAFIDSNIGTVSPAFSLDGSYYRQTFKHKPGFKVAFGMNFNHDNWDSLLEYTWFYGKFRTSHGVDINQFVIRPLRGHPEVLNATLGYDYAAQKWRLKMDLLDWDMGRSCYVGTKLIVRPSIGARAAWISQKNNLTYISTTAQLNTNAGTTSIVQRTHCWGIGPRAAFKGNWNIERGFRVIGNGGFDLLYTHYTKLHESGQFTTTANVVPNGSKNDIAEKSYGVLRPHAELEIGLGWGKHFDCHRWYLDFAATYGFQVFWNQNMFRDYSQATANTLSGLGVTPNGDLYIHGLNLSCRLDF